MRLGKFRRKREKNSMHAHARHKHIASIVRHSGCNESTAHNRTHLPKCLCCLICFIVLHLHKRKCAFVCSKWEKKREHYNNSNGKVKTNRAMRQSTVILPARTALEFLLLWNSLHIGSSDFSAQLVFVPQHVWIPLKESINIFRWFDWIFTHCKQR